MVTNGGGEMLMFVHPGQKAGYASASWHSLLQDGAMNSGAGRKSLFRTLCRPNTLEVKQLNQVHILPQQLYEKTGMELCIVTTELMQREAVYYHVKTTPHRAIKDAVFMSMSIPGKALFTTERTFFLIVRFLASFQFFGIAYVLISS